MSLKSGHTIKSVWGAEQERQKEDFLGNAVGNIRLQPDNWFFTLPFVDYADKYYDFQFRPSDVLIMTYPKCGTTWTQEIVWTMVHNPDLDHPLASLPVNARSPFLEFDFLMKCANMPPFEPGDELFDMFSKMCPNTTLDEGFSLELAASLPDRRVIKTHLPLSLLNPKTLETCKIIYVLRDPKDVAVSYQHHSRLFNGHGFVGTQDSFIDHFVNDTLVYSPYWKHVEEGWTNREHKNLHFCFYEDMKSDPKAEIKRMQDFIGLSLTDKQLDNIVEYTSFSSMKARDNVMGDSAKEGKKSGPSVLNADVIQKGGGFFRKGVAGDWKNKFTEEQAEKIDNWTKENVKDFGPEFKYGK